MRVTLDHCGEVHGQQLELEAPAARQLVLPCFVRVELDNPIEERQRLVLGRGVHVRRDCVLGVEAAGQSVFAEGVARLRPGPRLGPALPCPRQHRRRHRQRAGACTPWHARSVRSAGLSYAL